MGIETTQPEYLDAMREAYPDKFASIDRAIARIRRGARIFLGTGCGEPHFLVRTFADYVRAHPKAVIDAEIFQAWSVTEPLSAENGLQRHFRYNSLFISDSVRSAINDGMADYTPVFFSHISEVMGRGLMELDVALIMASPPDAHGWMSLGVSVDLVKAAVETAKLIIVQVNRHMPRVHGDAFINITDVDFVIPHDQPLTVFQPEPDTEAIQAIGRNLARLIRDGDTLRVGYGTTPNALLGSLMEKRNLGIHTEMLTDGIVELIQAGVIDNRRKTLNRGKTIAAFCMGSPSTYEFIHDNPQIQFHPIDVVSDPLIIARHDNMVSINSALSIDLTGEGTAVSIGGRFFSGIGGQADFMRGAMMSHGGRSILAMPSTGLGGQVSRILPTLPEGSGATFIRGDVHYVVTEYGIAYLHGKSIRERAMSLIAIAHPQFRAELIDEAKRRKLIYADQAFIPGERGEYRADLESYYKTSEGKDVLLRPVKLTDEPLLKTFFYRLSDKSLERRFMSMRHDMPHHVLQDFVVVDTTKETVLLAVLERDERDVVIGVGQYSVNEESHTAEIAFVVSDEYQHQSVGLHLLNYLTLLAKKQGLLGFTAEVLLENEAMMKLFEKGNFTIDRRVVEGCYELAMTFNETGVPSRDGSSSA